MFTGESTVKSTILALIALMAVSSAVAMDMKTCDTQVILSGHVDGTEYARLNAVFAAQPTVKVAVLRNSPGGDANTGYRVGALFREKGITTYVSGFCRSSCSRFFLGGQERFFTDDFPAEQTHVGFHSNYRKDGSIVPGAPERLWRFVKKYADGKADAALVNWWIHLADRRGFVYFFHPQALKRPDHRSVLLCQGHEPRRERWSQCEKISGHDALSMGIVTSLEVKRSCDAESSRQAVDR